jgi:hypothetical protein
LQANASIEQSSQRRADTGHIVSWGRPRGNPAGTVRTPVGGVVIERVTWQAHAVLRHAAATSSLVLALVWLGGCAKPVGSSSSAPDGPTHATEPTAIVAVAAPAPSRSEPPPRAEPSRDVSELAAMTLPPRPEWMDKYAGSAPDERFFDIAALMTTHDLDRARAVELQNHFRDLTRADPEGDRQAQYAEALRRAKAGEFEDGRDPQRLAKAPFIVVFDLDETLYDQSIKDPAVAKACHDLATSEGSAEPRYIALTPGWAEAIHRIDALGGEVVLFSANVDDRCYANARAWMLDGVPIHQHPAVAAFLTNSHLVLQPKQAGPPVGEPSKDLRIVDPDLSRAIIVDDNPLRLFQFRNARVYKKFEADAYCTTTDAAAKKAHEGALKVVVDEIEDSLRYMKAHPGVSFAQAYLPYTTLGQLAVRWLRTGTGRSEAKAIASLRAHPELADERF